MRIKTHPVIDFHGSSKDCGLRLQRLTEQKKATCVKDVDGGGWAFQAAKLRRESNVPHVIIYRQTAPGNLADDHPDLNLSPEAAAEELWRATVDSMPPELLPFKDIVYIEPTNEPGVVTAVDKQDQAKWIGQFCVAIANKMLADGWNPALAGFNAGTPSQQQIKDYFVDLLQLFANHRDRCLWTLHEAKLGGYKPGLDFKTKGLQPFVPDLINSSQRLFEVCDELGIRRPRTFISEFAWSHNDIPHKDQFRQEVQEACRMDAQWPEIVGRTIYTTHTGGKMWGKLRNKLNDQSRWLTEYVTTEMFEVEQASPPPQPTILPTRVSRRGADRAEAAGFMATIDLDKVVPGSSFQATWTFRNSGSSTWNGRYRFAHTASPHVETVDYQQRPFTTATTPTLAELGVDQPVKPGESVALTLNLTAPQMAGTIATNWQLQDDDGHAFGPVRWLRAQIVEPVTPKDDAGSLAYELLTFSNSAVNFDNVAAGLRFKGTWVLRNSGTSAWSGDFVVAYVDQSTTGTATMTRDTMGVAPSTTLQALSGRTLVNPGDEVIISIDLIAPKIPGTYAFHWELRDSNGRAFGGIRWLQIGVRSFGIPAPPKPAVGPTQFGMNMNLNESGQPLDQDRLAGLGWVRFVFWASRYGLSPEEAFRRHYEPIIQAYAAQGIRSLIILHQDTYWGNGPWDNGGWATYAEQFGKVCGRVAAACAKFGDDVAYQIYNEQDSGFGGDAGHENKSAIGINPQHYALVLAEASVAIRAAHPGSKVIFGGLKTGPVDALNYVSAVQQTLNGQLPVDALAYHPYGRYVKLALFNFAEIGKLGDALNRFKQAYPQLPLWITEMGVASDSHIPAVHYRDIATYINEVVGEIAANFSATVPVLIWFGWTDHMRNSGVNTRDNLPKEHVYDAFLAMKRRGQPTAKSISALMNLSEATFESYESEVTNANAVAAGSQFRSTWYFRNSGGRTWGQGYKLVYVARGTHPHPMMAQTSFALADVAKPAQAKEGDLVQISLDFITPEQTGRTYRSQWQLRDPQGKAFAYLYEEITVVPASTAGSGVRQAGMTFLADRTVPDGSRFAAGTDFDKLWQVHNSGARQWGKAFRLVFVEGDLVMAKGKVSHPVPKTNPGEEATLTIPMIAPPVQNNLPTEFNSLWRLQDDRDNIFGDPIWARIVSTPVVTPDSGHETALARLLNDRSLWYSQLDANWTSLPLGNGRANIGSWGCLLTCMAMALSAYGKRLNPAELNTAVTQLGARAIQGSNVQFLAPALILQGVIQGKNLRSWSSPQIEATTWTGEDPIQRIDNALAKGQIVLAQVDTKPNNNIYDFQAEQHWVIIVQRTPTGDDYLIIDPIIAKAHLHDQPRSLMVKYGNPNPSASNETNLRHAIKSTLVYRK